MDIQPSPPHKLIHGRWLVAHEQDPGRFVLHDTETGAQHALWEQDKLEEWTCVR